MELTEPLRPHADAPATASGVPLLTPAFASSMRRLIMMDDASPGGAPAPFPAGGYAPSPAACCAAAALVDDAVHWRAPDVARAARAGIAAGAAARGGGGGGGGRGACAAAALRGLLASRRWQWVLQAFVALHLSLAFFEHVPGAPPPPWHAAARAPVAALEALCLCAYAADAAGTLRTFGAAHFADKRWEAVFVGVAAAAAADWLLFYAVGLRGMWRFSRPLRPLLGLTKVPALRRLLASVLFTLPHIAQVTALLGVAVAFFAVLGVQLFNSEQVPNYLPVTDNFEDFPAAFLGIFVLTTTENYPSIGNPAFHARPWVGAAFFVTALFLFLWLLQPVVLAVVYDRFRSIQDGLARRSKVKARVSLVVAYQTLMGGDGAAELSREAFAVFFAHVRPGVSALTTAVTFAALDLDGSGRIGAAEFLRLPSVLELDVTEAGAGGAAGAGPWAAWAARAVETRAFAAAAAACALGASAAGAVWSLPLQRDFDARICALRPLPADDDMGGALAERGGGGGAPGLAADACTPAGALALSRHPIVVAELVGFIFLLGSAAEIALRALAHRAAAAGGARRAWALASGWNLLDALVVAYALVGSVGLLAGARAALPPGLADLFEASRAARVLRLASVWALPRGLVGALAGVLPLMGRVTAVYAALVYAFAVVGQALFAGVPPVASDLPGAADNPSKYSTASPGGLCEYCNVYSYGTFPLALLASFQISVGNNWNSVMYPNLQGVGSRWGALYFIAYRVLLTDVVAAIIESLMLDTFERRAEAARAAVADGEVAADIAARMGGGGGGGGGGAPKRSAGFLLRARADLMEELEAVEEAAKAGADGAGGRARALDASGVSPADLELVAEGLRALEAELRLGAAEGAAAGGAARW
jgi:hypothetical protein